MTDKTNLTDEQRAANTRAMIADKNPPVVAVKREPSTLAALDDLTAGMVTMAHRARDMAPVGRLRIREEAALTAVRTLREAVHVALVMAEDAADRADPETPQPPQWGDRS